VYWACAIVLMKVAEANAKLAASLTLHLPV